MGGTATSGSSVDQLPDLGSAADADALVALVRQHRAASPEGAAPSPTTTVAGPSHAASAGVGSTTDDAACVTSVQTAHPDLGPIDLVAHASLAGQTVEVLVFGTASNPVSGARVLAVRPADCQVLVDRPA